MGFTSYDNMIALMTVSGYTDEFDFMKTGSAAQAAGQWHSLWKAAGYPGAGVNSAGTPGTSYVLHPSGGAYYNNVSPLTRHMLTFGAAASVAGTLMIYDRLVGVSTTLVGAGTKALSTIALPRYTDGIGVQPWIELTTATTTSATVCRISGYTNELGQTGRFGPTLTFPSATTVVDWMAPIPLATGDMGVRAITSLDISTAPAAGVGNILLIKPLAYLPIPANTWNERDLVLQLAALPRLYDGATLGFAYLASATTANNFWGNIRVAHG